MASTTTSLRPRKKILAIFGTRPEAIKMAPVVREFKRRDLVDCYVCVTAQHREMLDQVLQVFDIVPDCDLALMRPNQSLSELTARAMTEITALISQIKPDLVIVQGDTTTVLAGALASFYCRIPLAHVEAGLRTYDMLQPWPEEANRVLTSRLVSLHFAPTEANRQNLIREGVDEKTILVTGNTVVDALLIAVENVRENKPRIDGLSDSDHDDISKNGVVLITAHRRENVGQGLENICLAVRRLAKDFPSVLFVLPVHLNPGVRAIVFKILRGCDASKNLRLVDPLPYPGFVWLMDRARLIITDSGGIQEEAPSLGKYVLVTRETTERPEAMDSGFAELVGTSCDRIYAAAQRVLHSRTNGRPQQSAAFGDGQAALRIVQHCEAFVGP